MTAPRIRFSHRYCKMPVGFERSKLIQVLKVRIEELSPDFLDYDTRYPQGNYPLPDRGEFLLLLLLADGVLWTTLRRATPAKAVYYRSIVGRTFNCEVVE